jgi:hypothetical protein
MAHPPTLVAHDRGRPMCRRWIAGSRSALVDTGLAIIFVVGFGFLVLFLLAATGWLIPRNPSVD